MDRDDPEFSSHARRRSQARSIPPQIVNLILDHADREKQVGNGVSSYMVTKRRLQRLRDVPHNVREKMRGVVVLRAGDGCVVTAFHAHGRRAWWYWRQ
jgi:hypothetical protein